MGLNNFGICRPLRCSHTLKDEFLSSSVSAPSSLLVTLSKDVGCEAFSTHCTSMQMTMTHYSCLFLLWKEGSRAYTQMTMAHYSCLFSCSRRKVVVPTHRCGNMASRKERDTSVLIGLFLHFCGSDSQPIGLDPLRVK